MLCDVQHSPAFSVYKLMTPYIDIQLIFTGVVIGLLVLLIAEVWLNGEATCF